MPTGQDQEKTEPATPKRREEARKKGEVAQSKEIPSTLILMTGVLVFYFFGSYMIQNLLAVTQNLLGNVGTTEVNLTNAYDFALKLFRDVALVLAPLMVALVISGIAGNVLQKGFLFSGHPLIPKFSKIDPIKGTTKMFSAQSLMELFKSIMKILIVGYVAFLTVKGEQENLLPLMMMEPAYILSYIAKVSFNICVRTLWILIPLAAVDYAFQRWQYEKNLKMSKQEIKDEYKQREGDPLVKGRIKSVQREMARRRMMEEVPKADVVITNPTELAVALHYDRMEMTAPKVVAKGAGFIAERIRKIAAEKNVPIVENRSLARSLYKLVEIGQYVPQNLYKAIAEVLAYVYRLKKNTF